MISFARLQQALQFLVTNLERDRHVSIADACVAGEGERDEQPVSPAVASLREARLVAIGVLAERHQELDLRTRYGSLEFPADASDFKIGGHADGHLHVDFVRVGRGWQLKEIWRCR